ncbi:MAG: carotenoid oxygenase family protein [Candidatus Eremiobacteraeota bacterium]|nr:carotenoid oxygenase family protein [Candidatus Eremiobacteraeota bacterium]
MTAKSWPGGAWRTTRPSSTDGSETLAFSIGFHNCPERDRTPLQVEGKLPPWLTGTLLRNGPGRFDLDRQSYRHWFDGLAQLHRFELAGGGVTYSTRYLQSQDFVEAQTGGKIPYPAFASDPCWTLFRRLKALFWPDVTKNPNVNLGRLEGRWLALTELPMPIEFDPETLETVGVFDFRDRSLDGLTTAHPHQDQDRWLNYGLRFGRQTAYHFYDFDGSGRRRPLACIPQSPISYVHSFGLTPRYVVLALFPFVVHPLKLLFRYRPFIENFRWQPERGTTFCLLDRHSGQLRRVEGPPVFAFHHVNAYEEGEEVVVDLVGYPDASMIDRLYLDSLRRERPVPAGQLYRFRLPVRGQARLEWRSEETLELPRLDYARCNGRRYRYTYGVSLRPDQQDLFNQLIRLDVENRTSRRWLEDGCYPGEPVFVARPGGQGENDGVVLSVILDTNQHQSFLLVLEAGSFEELARARVPQVIPFGFHGDFVLE